MDTKEEVVCCSTITVVSAISNLAYSPKRNIIVNYGTGVGKDLTLTLTTPMYQD